MARNEVPRSVRASLYIDGKPAQNSIKNVEQVTRNLRKELNGLTIGTAEWNAKMRDLKHAQSTLRGIRDEVNGVGGAFGWLRSEVGKLGTLAVGYLGFQFVTSQFQNIISQNAKLSDSLADIRRVAGLTEDEVRKLDKSFGELDTRTSKSGLRDIAQVAGRLGVAKDDILGFVEATDMLVVALGDELGNADQITTQLGKILNVFDGEVNGDNITRLGNAMVKLANDGVASAGFISDFTQRVSGMAKTAGMGLGATVGLAAGLEEMGARAESGATAVQNLLLSIGRDMPKAAKIAGMELQEFNQLFGATPELALLKYAEGLTQNKTAFSDVAVAFADAGEEGMRVIETMTKLGERAEFMRSKFNDGKEALQGYNEIQDAFALKNETLGAKMDKLGKSFNAMAVNKALVSFFTSLVEVATDVTDGLGAIGNETEALYASFSKQSKVVADLEGNLLPLLDRYDQLIAKGNRSKEEQTELNTIIERITMALPEAATQFDEYGKAIAVSTSRAREFIETQKALLQYKNQEALASAKEDLEDYNERLKEIQHTLKTGRSTFVQDIFFPNTTLELRDDYRAKLVQELKVIGELKKGAEEYIKTLSGENIEIKKPEGNDTPTTVTPSGSPVDAEALKKAEADRKKAAEKRTNEIKKDQNQLRELLQKNLNDIYIDSLEGSEKELAQLDAKYDEMRRKAHGNADMLKQIDEQYNRDFLNLLKKTTKATEEEAEKRAIAEAEAFEKVELAGMSARELELRQMEDHYAELLRLAEEYGFDATQIKKDQAEADRKLREQWAKEDREKQEQEAIEERERKYQWAVDSAKLVADTAFSIGENRREAELQSALSRIEKERDAALANENLTEQQKKKINEEFDKKAKAEKQKAFKADQKAAISQAIINGLVGAGQLWIKPGFPAAIPLAAMLAAQTAANVAVIASQKAPEYADGGPTDRDPAGYVSKATLFNRSASGRPFVAGERGREWIAPNWMLNTPQFADIIGMLETARQEKRFFAGGGSTQSNGGSGGSAYDFRRLESLMHTFIQEQKQANRRTPRIVYKDLEDFEQRIDYTRALQGKYD